MGVNHDVQSVVKKLTSIGASGISLVAAFKGIPRYVEFWMNARSPVCFLFFFG
jgi:hypothetical protein